MRPENLILRCYGTKSASNTWVLKCIDLALVVEENTLKKAQKSLEENIIDYIETVFDTNDKESIPKLLKRKSPLSDIIEYHTIACVLKIHELKSRLVFEKAIPFHLSPC